MHRADRVEMNWLRLMEYLGDTELLEELERALGLDKLEEYIEYIATNHDIPIVEEDEIGYYISVEPVGSNCNLYVYKDNQLAFTIIDVSLGYREKDVITNQAWAAVVHDGTYELLKVVSGNGNSIMIDINSGIVVN